MQKITSNNIFKSRMFPLVLAIFFIVPLILLFSQQKTVDVPISPKNNDAAVLGAVDTASGNPAPNGPKGDYHLVFSDEFNGNALDLTKWITCNPSFDYSCHPKNNEQEYNASLTNNKNIVVSGGQLHLVATNTNGQMRSGMVSTGPNKFKANQPGYKGFSYTYGYYEGRVKMPKGKGFWPSMWQLPWDQQGKGGWPKSGEYDVVEIPGNNPTDYHFTIHWLGDGRCGLSQCEGGVKKVADTSAGFHTFGLLWEEKKLTWYMDGVVQGTLDKPAAIKNYPFYIIANFAVGGKWGPLGCNKDTGAFPCGGGYPPFPTSMDIDYLRVWQKGKPTTTVPTPSKVVPTYVCAGSTNNICPTSTPTKANTPTTVVTNPTTVVDPTEPTDSASDISPVPTVAPCDVNDLSIQTGSHKKKVNGNISSFIQLLLQFFIELLQQLIALIGGGTIPTPATGNGSPCPSPTLAASVDSVSKFAAAGVVTNPSPSPSTPPVTTNGLEKFEPPDGKVYLGMSSQPKDIDNFVSTVGIKGPPAIYGFYTDGNIPDAPFSTVLKQVENRPTVAPLVSWNIGMGKEITNGAGRDAYIRARARESMAFNKPIFLRPAWEMNGSWYPKWSLPAVSPSQYAASWKRIYTVFEDEYKKAGKQSNVAWVWCPNNGPYNHNGSYHRTSEWYPGDQYVNWVCIDAYPWTNNFNGVFTGTDNVNDITAFAASHNKPMMLGEWGPPPETAGSAASINTVFDWAERNPNTVKALVYFHFDKFMLNRGDHTVPKETFRKRTIGNSRYINSIVK